LMIQSRSDAFKAGSVPSISFFKSAAVAVGVGPRCEGTVAALLDFTDIFGGLVDFVQFSGAFFVVAFTATGRGAGTGAGTGARTGTGAAATAAVEVLVGVFNALLLSLRELVIAVTAAAAAEVTALLAVVPPEALFRAARHPAVVPLYVVLRARAIAPEIPPPVVDVARPDPPDA